MARPRVQTAVIEIPDIAAIIKSQGQTYRFDMLKRSLKRAAGEKDAGMQKDFKLRERILVVEGIHIAGDRPFCFEHRIVSLATAPDAAIVDFEAVAPGSWLLGHIPWSQARHRIMACNAGRTAAFLKIPANAACLKVERWTWLRAKPVTYVRQMFPGDRYDLTAQFSP